MSDYHWPDPATRPLLGKNISRVDGPVKVSGRAKYTYDYNPDGLLAGKILRCPYAHARITSIDTSAAEKMPGVKAVQIIQKPGTEIFWAGDEIVAVAAVDELTAEDALRAINVHYNVLPHFISDAEPPKNIAATAGPISHDDFEDMEDNQVPDEQVIASIKKNGISFHPDEKYLKDTQESGVDPSVVAALRSAKVCGGDGHQVALQENCSPNSGRARQGFRLGAPSSKVCTAHPCITHCCLETHGMAAEWTGDKDMLVQISTQNLSGIAPQIAEPLGIPAGNIQVMQQYIGGGFGSKFGPDRWGIAAAQLSKTAGGKPVKIMLDRAEEQEVAGMRPSAFARVKVAADKERQARRLGVALLGHWRHGRRRYASSARTSSISPISASRTSPSQPTRAALAPGALPNHPQAALITMSAIEDLAAKLNLDPVDLLTRNLDLTGARAGIYRDELPIAMELMEWKKNWHPRGDKTAGHIKRGLGLSIHTWGGRGHNSDCDLTIHPDGSVEIKMATQDLGTGARTIIIIVAADALGIPMDSIKLLIGDSRYPVSGASGGSTTIGRRDSSTRRAAVDARSALFAKVAPALKAQPEELEAVDGNGSGEERSQPQPGVEGRLREDWRNAADHPRQESRQIQATRPDQQRRRRSADGRCLRRYRDRNRAREQDGRGAGLWTGRGCRNRREPGAWARSSWASATRFMRRRFSIPLPGAC